MDSIIPRFTGTRALGCSIQVERARSSDTSVFLVKDADSKALEARSLIATVSPEMFTGCRCRIAENGCIDPSECPVTHLKIPIPVITRWCDATTSLIQGAGHLVFWSGWARPAVLSITARFPTVNQVRALLARSDQRTTHVNFRFDYRIRTDAETGLIVVDVSPKAHSEKAFYKVKDLLNALPGARRFGQHSEFNPPPLPGSG